MRIFVRNDPWAKTYFDFDEVPLRPDIGKLIREVVEPFCRGHMVMDIAGRLWLRPTGMEKELQYINCRVETLANACERWLATPKQPGPIADFEEWLYSVDEACRTYEETHPFTFWGCEIGDCLEPFLPLPE